MQRKETTGCIGVFPSYIEEFVSVLGVHFGPLIYFPVVKKELRYYSSCINIVILTQLIYLIYLPTDLILHGPS